MYKVYLSPSTQENNFGVSDYGTEEIMMNTIADVTAKELTRTGQFIIYRNRPTMTLNEVIKDSDNIKPNIHVAIHSNAFNSAARGALGLYWSGGGIASDSYKLTKAIYDEILNISGHANGIRAGTGLAETDRVKATSTIIEVGFHDNTLDAQWIEDNIKNIGIAIAKGICEYCNVPYVPYVTPVEEVIIVEPELTFDEALQIVKGKVDIDTEYWKQANEYDKYIDLLFIKFAKAIR